MREEYDKTFEEEKGKGRQSRRKEEMEKEEEN